MLDRRAFLKSSLTFSAVRLGGLSLLGTTATTQISRAEPVTIAIAAAAAVAGMIAAHNRGDGGLSAYLAALNGKMDVAIGQLGTLQASVATILTTLAGLPGQIDASLKDNDIRNLHDLTFSVVKSYTDLIRVRNANYATDQEFLASTGVREDIQGYLQRLDQATSLLETKRAFGPATAIVIPSAFLVKNSLLNLRGDKPKDIAVRLQSSMDWLNNVVDPTIAESTTMYRAAAVLRHNQYLEAASKTAFGGLLNSPGTAPLDCVGVNDHMPAHEIELWCREYTYIPRKETLGMFQPAAFQARNFSEAAHQSSDKNDMAGFVRVPCPRHVDERNGPHDRVYENLTVESKPYEAEMIISGEARKEPAGFIAFFLARSGRSGVVPEGTPGVPKECDIRTANEPDAGRRNAVMQSTLNNSPRNQELANFAALLDAINVERARIAFSTSSLTIVAQARDQLQKMITESSR
jgi:hypothetical protein